MGQSKVNYFENDVRVNGFKLHYLEWGNKGPNIILLHGSAPYCSAHDLKTIGQALSHIHHIIAFDLIGHAHSDDPAEPLGFEKHVKVLREAAKSKGFDKVTLIGWSYGGWLSMTWANLYPETVERIILIDIVPVTYREPTPQDPENTPEFFHSDEEAIEFYLGSYSTFHDRPPIGYLRESLRLSKRGGDGRVYPLSHHSRRLNLRKELDLWSVFSGISVPMLLISGGASFIPVEMVDRMRSANNNLKIVSVEGANHFVPLSHVDETISAVESFLEE